MVMLAPAVGRSILHPQGVGWTVCSLKHATSCSAPVVHPLGMQEGLSLPADQSMIEIKLAGALFARDAFDRCPAYDLLTFHCETGSIGRASCVPALLCFGHRRDL